MGMIMRSLCPDNLSVHLSALRLRPGSGLRCFSLQMKRHSHGQTSWNGVAAASAEGQKMLRVYLSHFCNAELRWLKVTKLLVNQQMIQSSQHRIKYSVLLTLDRDMYPPVHLQFTLVNTNQQQRDCSVLQQLIYGCSLKVDVYHL